MRTRVNVKLLHDRCRDTGTCWCEPVGWSAKRPSCAEDDWEFCEGTYWSEHEEELGMAVQGHLFVSHNEGDVVDVPMENVFWSTCGDIRFAEQVELEK